MINKRPVVGLLATASILAIPSLSQATTVAAAIVVGTCRGFSRRRAGRPQRRVSGDDRHPDRLVPRVRVRRRVQPPRRRLRDRHRQQDRLRFAHLRGTTDRSRHRDSCRRGSRQRRCRNIDVLGRRHHVRLRNDGRADPRLGEHAVDVGGRPVGDQPADDHVGSGDVSRRHVDRRSRRAGDHDQRVRRPDIHRGARGDGCPVGRSGRPVLRRRAFEIHLRGRGHRPAGFCLLRAVPVRGGLRGLGASSRVRVDP